MTTKLKAPKFRVRRPAGAAGGVSDTQAPTEESQVADRPDESGPDDTADIAARPAPGPAPRPAPGPAPRPDQNALSGAVTSADEVAGQDEMAALRREGLTGRQLRMARRVAAKHGLNVVSDFDAVLQLRRMGIDPFQRSTVLELVVPSDAGGPQGAPGQGGGGGGRPQLPQTVPSARPGGGLPTAARAPHLPSTEVGSASPVDQGMAEVQRIQKDLARRRRYRMSLLLVRLAVFVLLPTLAAGYYFFRVATPMYATFSEFVIQQAEPQGAGGLGSLFQGTSMATQQDAIGVQAFLMSREAMLRLDTEEGFKAHFSDPQIDPLQALAPDASNEAAYDIYQDRVRVSYDPTEGLLRMEVAAADPETSERFSKALVTYAEEQVDQQTLRLREDQMRGARESYEAAEARREAALKELLTLQEELETIDPAGETAARTQLIATLQTRLQELQVELQTRLAVRRPNEAQVEALQSQIGIIENQIAEIQSSAVDGSAGASQAQKNTQLRLAEENYTLQTLLVQQAVQSMETAQIEANRQVRYLSLTVPPVAPDEPTYPRAFENTILAFLLFAGLYLMISITGSILREQVSS